MMRVWAVLRCGVCVLTIAFGAAQGAIAQQVIPGKTMRLILGFPPGGAVDLIGRAIGPGISETLGPSVVVDNRPGANGAIGAELLVKSPPDGTAIGLVSISSMVLNVIMMPNPSYHTLRDFTPITNVGLVPFALAVHPAVPAKSLKELIALARAQPGKLTVGSPGVGGLQHLAIEMLNDAAKVKLTHIPYKGTGPAMTDVLGGHIDGMMTAVSGVITTAKSGKLKVVAVTAAERTPALPEVPTAQEQGLPGFLVVNWYGIVGPANMPAAPLNALHGAIVKTVANPGVREKLVASGVDPKTDASPAVFAAFVKDEFARWSRVIKQSGIKME